MGYTPLSEYGLIGNDDRCALASSDGSIDWCCFPHVASPSVFARLLDADRGGHFALRPTDSYDSQQAYLDRTNILQTTFETDSGQAVLTDFMPVSGEGSQSTFQPAIYRRLRCTDGTLQIECEFVPRFDYARAETTVESTDETDAGLIARGGDETLFVQSHGPLDLRTAGDDRAVGFCRLTEGQTVWVGLQYDEYTEMPPEACRRSLTDTRQYWEEWVAEFEQSATEIVDDNSWYEHVVRSGLVLKLLINSGSGAIYAAPTTSLPETYGGDHNWDYRYNWIRDAKFTVQALYNFGRTDEAERYFEWFRTVSDSDPEAIQPLYGVHGETELTEFELEHLSGYRHSAPVRVGNAAFSQQQTDVYGAIIQGIYETLQHGERLSADDWASVRAIVDHVCDVWDEPDAGIWEFRGPQRHYLHSKLLCWVAVDRGLELARQLDRSHPADRWESTREAIRTAILEEGYSEQADSFVQHFETDRALDASCLLIPIYEFLPADDPRVESTIETVLDELLDDDGLVYRTKYTEAIPPEPNAFLLCTFWLVDALVLAGQTERATELFETALSHRSPLGLLAERVDPATGELFGNFPQAFSHLGVINSAIYLCCSENPERLTHDPQSATGDVSPLFRRQQ